MCPWTDILEDNVPIKLVSGMQNIIIILSYYIENKAELLWEPPTGPNVMFECCKVYCIWTKKKSFYILTILDPYTHVRDYTRLERKTKHKSCWHHWTILTLNLFCPHILGSHDRIRNKYLREIQKKMCQVVNLSCNEQL